MGTRELSEAEQEFASLLAQLIGAMGAIQAAAQRVAATGGDCRETFLSMFDDPEVRAQASMQWMFIAPMLGVS